MRWTQNPRSAGEGISEVKRSRTVEFGDPALARNAVHLKAKRPAHGGLVDEENAESAKNAEKEWMAKVLIVFGAQESVNKQERQR
jgi:hypothetical protein